MDDRYECIQEPGNSWLVWDLLLDEPAMFDACLLMSLTEAEAQCFCASLNKAHRRSADEEAAPAKAVRSGT